MIPFNDLKRLHQYHEDEINTAVLNVLSSGWYILGGAVQAFEQAFADYHGVKHAVAVANGTDAIELALRAADIGAGDEVITVSHTAMPTISAIEGAGAAPVLVDIDAETYTIDPAAVEAAITPRTRAIIPVHLYGQPADLEQLAAIAGKHHLLLLEDCAQAHGARYKNQLVGTFGQMATFSFYPTKNLAAYGDGGAIITDDDQLAERLGRLRNYGQSSRYVHIERGTNSRMDDIQGAILNVKLRHLDEHNQQRQRIAAMYTQQLEGVTPPPLRDDVSHVFHLYVIRHPQRNLLQSQLRTRGVETLIHYPVPNHLQASHADLGYKPSSLPVTEHITREILSLPLFVGLTDAECQQVIQTVNQVVMDL